MISIRAGLDSILESIPTTELDKLDPDCIKFEFGEPTLPDLEVLGGYVNEISRLLSITNLEAWEVIQRFNARRML